MKFNWGSGIFLFYSVFAATLFYQVYKSTQYDNSLVVDNYYDYDLAYQSRYERKANSLALSEPLTISYDAAFGTIELHFPDMDAMPAGEVLFYRANDRKQDQTLPIKLDDQGRMRIAGLTTGRWKVAVDWSAAGRDYYDEQTIDVFQKR